VEEQLVRIKPRRQKRPRTLKQVNRINQTSDAQIITATSDLQTITEYEEITNDQFKEKEDEVLFAIDVGLLDSLDLTFFGSSPDFDYLDSSVDLSCLLLLEGKRIN
jgi:hypothetical protein